MTIHTEKEIQNIEIDPSAAAAPVKRMLRQRHYRNMPDLLEDLALLGRSDASCVSERKSGLLIAREPEDLFELVRSDLYGLGREQLHVVTLSKFFSVLAKRLIYEGTVNGIRRLEARDVFRDALLTDGVYIVMFHNHPSGNIRPSPLDKRTTKDICRKGRLLDIDVLDHIITYNNRAFSMRRAKMLPKMLRKNK